MLQGPLASAQQSFYTVCSFKRSQFIFLFEIYEKQLNRKSVRFHFFHQNGLVMSGVSALTTLWCSQPQELVLQHQSSCAEPFALAHALQGLPVLRAECQRSFSLTSPSQRPCMGRDTHLPIPFNPSVPKKAGAKTASSLGKTFPAVCCRRGRKSALSAYRRSLLWRSEQCVGQAKPQLGCQCAQEGSTKSWSSANTSRKTKDGDKSTACGSGLDGKVSH